MKERILLVILLICIGNTLLAQRYLVVDRYGMKRIKLAEGDRITFSLKKDGKIRYKDYIAELQDSSIVLANRKISVKLSEISALYFNNDLMLWLQGGSTFVGAGFVINAAVHPLVSDAQYDPKESLIIGASFLAISQVARLLRRKKFKINDNTRIRILDLSFQQPAVESINK